MYAFYWCDSLTELIIGNGVHTLEDFAIGNCPKLVNVSIPSSLKSIGSLFSSCDAIEGTVYNDVVYVGNASNAYLCALYPLSSDVESVTLHRDTLFMNSYAFENCKKLTSITLNQGLLHIGYGAFGGCSSLKEINVPSTVSSLDAHVFENCTSLVEITIPDGIGFLASSLFSNCTQLKTVNIPNSITYIATNVFTDCSSLEVIVFRGTSAEWKNISKYSPWDSGTPEYTVKCTDVDVNKAS